MVFFSNQDALWIFFSFKSEKNFSSKQALKKKVKDMKSTYFGVY